MFNKNPLATLGMLCIGVVLPQVAHTPVLSEYSFGSQRESISEMQKKNLITPRYAHAIEAFEELNRHFGPEAKKETPFTIPKDGKLASSLRAVQSDLENMLKQRKAVEKRLKLKHEPLPSHISLVQSSGKALLGAISRGEQFSTEGPELSQLNFAIGEIALFSFSRHVLLEGSINAVRPLGQKMRLKYKQTNAPL